VSLVEKALKKLQDAKALLPAASSTREPATVVVGALVNEDKTQSTASVPRRSGRLVRIDQVALRKAGLLPPENQERRLAGEYRQIKRPLIAAALGKGREPLVNGRMIMVASALPGEGKTFTTMNLALSMALEKDTAVLLVDADVAKPHISTTFGVEKEPGLVDALADSSIDIESLVIPTDIKGLSLLPAGRTVETATELLASSRMEQLMAELARADTRRIILFDSPPLLLTNESRALANVVGQIALVVRAGVTARSSVSEALSFLDDNKSIGLILNQSEPTSTNAYYGYGYGYGT